MILYLSKILILLLFSIFTAFNFYYIFPNHIASFSWYIPYLLTVIVIYAVYKYLQRHDSRKSRDTSIPITNLLFVFLANLFVMSIYYFSISWSGSWILWFTLFFKILGFLILPILIFLISTWFWNRINSLLLKWEEIYEDKPVLLDLALWFVSFLSLLTLFSIFWFYNWFVVLVILFVFWVISYDSIKTLIKKIFSIKFVFEKDKFSQSKLIIWEFFVFLAIFVLSISLISIVRPYPIWWDDLWVYMNYPHLLAEAKTAIPLWMMYSWQIFTGIGYMFNSATQAFFLNISWLILTFFVLNSVLWNLIKSDKKTLLPIPIILSVLYISLPMVMFHSTKDMKVEEWLFFLTVIALYYLYAYFQKLKSEDFKNISIYLMLIIWIIAGFCFSIKFTSLLLIVAILAVITYARLWWIWVLWYTGIFLWTFTLFNFWKFMNVNINPAWISWLETKIWLFFLIPWLLVLAFSLFKNKDKIVFYFKEILIFLLWVLVILIPWFWKNIYETKSNFSFYGLVIWGSEYFNVDYNKIYTKDEIEQIKIKKEKDWKKEWLTTTNEDYLRYIWYESWILKYTNIFWNLTMQKNQSWEFTNIWFLFFALLPLIFIFLPYKNKYYFLFFVFFAIFQVYFYSTPLSNKPDSETLSKFDSRIIEILLKNDSKVFEDKAFNKDIYDIDVRNYYSKEELFASVKGMEETKAQAQALLINDKSWVKRDEDYYLNLAAKASFPTLQSQVNSKFYSELKNKVMDPSVWPSLEIISSSLTDKDFEYIKLLNNKYWELYFASTDIVDFKNILTNAEIRWEEREQLIKLWYENRTISWKITDYFANINFPIWYVYLILFFLVPITYLLFTLKKTDLNYLFKLNLVFAGLYVFIWLISSFWIVWYWITMYFSFLLMIWLWAFYISAYKENDKKLNAKIIWSSVFLLIILFHFFTSIIPYLFNNLKDSWFAHYKAWTVWALESVFTNQRDYSDILFELNISNDKKQEFLKEKVDKKLYDWYKLEDKDFAYIEWLLKAIQNQEGNAMVAEAKKSLHSIYNWLLNPSEKYKNKQKIYRIWTFLKYYISENHNRLHEDSLVFSFNDYIYSEDIDITIDRFKKLWLDYILIDLNTATIDKSLDRTLTSRYEKLVQSLVSDRLELISTDSLCLQLWLEAYKNNEDIWQYMTFATVNHNSYEENNIIWVKEKRLLCVSFLNDLIEKDLISKNSYSFLEWNKETLKSLEWNVNELNNFIWGSYKALFKIKD